MRNNSRNGFALLVFGIGVAMAAYDGLVIMIDYSRVQARVERVALLCRTSSEPIEQAVDCSVITRSSRGPGKVIENAVVYLSYTSPADNKEHHGTVVPFSKRQIRRVRQLRPGDPLEILVHDDDPSLTKMLNY